MNNETLERAQASYDAGDFASALTTFTECLQDRENPVVPGEIGLLYHRIGNCLMKLRDFDEAIHAYTQATADAEYDGVGTVNCNLGNSYAALHDYENAVKHFEIAVSDQNYGVPYKAHAGMGKAYLKLGKYAEAGAAFRSAALDEANPDPSQALLNLGICFMALNRPDDAVASYESALQFRMSPETKNKLYANLGQAYVAAGDMQNAVNAFEMALADKTYFLNDAASVDYQSAVGAVAQGTAVMAAVEEEGESASDMSGFDISSDGSSLYPDVDPEATAQDPHYFADSVEVDDNYSNGTDRFLNASDEELEQWSRGVVREDRKRRNVGLKAFVTIVVLALIIAAACVLAYTQGLGYPTQESVVSQLFADKAQATTEVLAPDLDSASIQRMLDPVLEDDNAVIDSVERSMNTSVAYATATTTDGGDVHYKISMIRDGIGWKINNIELYFPSQEQ